MTLPSYRRTRGPFVTLYRSLDGVETELAHAFGETAHAKLDSVQQEDLLMIAESAGSGTRVAMKEPEMKTTTNPVLEHAKNGPYKCSTKKEALELLKEYPLSCVLWDDNGKQMSAIYWNGKRCVQPVNKKINWSKPLPSDWPHVSDRSY